MSAQLALEMRTEQLMWSWQGKSIELGFDTAGRGALVLLLPAMSSISTRHEMRPLQERLSAYYSLPGVRSSCLPHGKLGLHEEFPDAVAQAVEPFLAEGLPAMA